MSTHMTAGAASAAPSRMSTTTATEFFAPQPTTSANLPDPRMLITNLARSIVEVFAGAREVEQLARWVTDDVYRHLIKRVVLARRARAAIGRRAALPRLRLGSTTITHPADGVVEAVVVVHQRARSRAVAIRLEGFDRRWRASAINVL